jgi:hypothetical protein
MGIGCVGLGLVYWSRLGNTRTLTKLLRIVASVVGAGLMLLNGAFALVAAVELYGMARFSLAAK